MKTGYVYQNKRNKGEYYVESVEEKGKTCILVDENGGTKSVSFATLKKDYKLIDEGEEKPKAAKGKGGKAAKAEKAEKSSKKSNAKSEKKSKKSEPLPENEDFKAAVKELKDLNKKKGVLAMLTVVFAESNYTKKYSELQRTYRAFSHQEALMPKAAKDIPILMFAASGDDILELPYEQIAAEDIESVDVAEIE